MLYLAEETVGDQKVSWLSQQKTHMERRVGKYCSWNSFVVTFELLSKGICEAKQWSDRREMSEEVLLS